jgi:hypothetical protein
VYPWIIRREEAYLLGRYPEEYASYCSHVPRFFPRLSQFTEPATWVVNPRLFRRTMIDVIWFVWLVALIEFVEALHESGLVSPWFALP